MILHKWCSTAVSYQVIWSIGSFHASTIVCCYTQREWPPLPAIGSACSTGNWWHLTYSMRDRGSEMYVYHLLGQEIRAIKVYSTVLWLVLIFSACALLCLHPLKRRVKFLTVIGDMPSDISYRVLIPYALNTQVRNLIKWKAFHSTATSLATMSSPTVQGGYNALQKVFGLSNLVTCPICACVDSVCTVGG